MSRRYLVCVALSLVVSAAHAAPIASSITEFSSAQGQDGWYYGYFNQGPNGAVAYTTSAFETFDTFGVVTAATWGASDAAIGAQNNDYIGLGSTSGHPTGLAPPDAQDSIIWAVRRYVSEVAGDIAIQLDLRKENPNPNGGGITGRVFIDGAEVYTRYVAATDITGFQTILVHNVAVDSLIDFAIDPLGVAINNDGIYSARADGTIFSAVISPYVVPVAPSFVLMLGGLLGLVASGQKRRTPKS